MEDEIVDEEVVAAEAESAAQIEAKMAALSTGARSALLSKLLDTYGNPKKAAALPTRAAVDELDVAARATPAVDPLDAAILNALAAREMAPGDLARIVIGPKAKAGDVNPALYRLAKTGKIVKKAEADGTRPLWSLA